MTNKNTPAIKNDQSKPSSTSKPAIPTPRPTPSQGQTVSKNSKIT